MKARPLFIGGTSSNAGKSWMTTAICAWLRGRGVSVAPFKAQNMSNNSYPCAGGGEIGRAQVAQAEACGLEPEPSMNPILLKPNGNGGSQVVVNGRMWKTLSARDYYTHVNELRPVVLAAYEDLANRFDVILIEGAGSVSELNLREHDLVNLWLVSALQAPWLLVADIERGGVFASVIGSVGLLSPDERALLCGFAINKFRGDPALFDDAIPMLEERTASRCVGVFPYLADVHLDPEDSLALRAAPGGPAPSGARIAIVRFPQISNTTDFSLLTWAVWITSPSEEPFDFIVLPGSKNTLSDLAWLRRTGLAEWILHRRRQGATIVGVCGGYQMLGLRVFDPAGLESEAGWADGLGLIPAVTELAAVKTTRAVAAVTPGGIRFDAYEIHLGITTCEPGAALTPFAKLDNGAAEGIRDPGVIGTYLHGAFESPGVCAEVFGARLPPAASKSSHYRRMAMWFEEHVRDVADLGIG